MASTTDTNISCGLCHCQCSMKGADDRHYLRRPAQDLQFAFFAVLVFQALDGGLSEYTPGLDSGRRSSGF